MTAGETPGPRRALWLAAALLLYALPLGTRDLWNPDEPRYARVAQEMRLSGQYLIPHLNGEVYAEKPPGFFWLILACSPFGVTAWSARLPSVLAAVGTLLLTYRLGTRLGGAATGGWAAVVLGSALKFCWQSSWGQSDMVLTFLITLAAWGLWRAVEEARAAPGLLAWGVMALGTMMKGPVAILLPLGGLATALIGRRDWRRLGRLVPAGGLSIFFGLLLAWQYLAFRALGWDYIYGLTVRQTVERFFNPWHHHQPWYYFGPVLLADFLPWSLLLPAAVAWWRRRPAPERAAWWLPVGWAGFILVFFSLSSGKRSVYLLPLYPAAALLVGGLLARYPAQVPDTLRRWGVQASLLVFLGLFLLVPAAGLSLKDQIDLGQLPPVVEPTLWAMAGISLAALLAGGVRPRWLPRLAPGVTVIGFLLITLVAFPALNAEKSHRPLTAAVLERVESPDRLRFYRDHIPGVLFYSGLPRIPMIARHELAATFAEERPLYLLIKRRYYEDVVRWLRWEPRILYRDQVGHQELWLLTNRPVGPTLVRGAAGPGDQTSRYCNKPSLYGRLRPVWLMRGEHGGSGSFCLAGSSYRACPASRGKRWWSTPTLLTGCSRSSPAPSFPAPPTFPGRRSRPCGAAWKTWAT